MHITSCSLNKTLVHCIMYIQMQTYQLSICKLGYYPSSGYGYNVMLINKPFHTVYFFLCPASCLCLVRQCALGKAFRHTLQVLQTFCFFACGALSHSLCMLSARSELYRRKTLFLDDFPIFFIQMSPGPTYPLPIFFWIFGIFLTLQSP